MKNREELVYKLFIGKVSEVLGIERTTGLLKEANEAFPRCTHNEGIDKKVYVNKEFTGLYCEKCDEVYCGSI